MTDRRNMLAKLFGSKGAKVNTNNGQEYYDNLLKQMETRLDELE